MHEPSLPEVLHSQSPHLPEGDLQQQLQDLLNTVRQHFGMNVAFISRFENGRRIFEQVSSDGPSQVQVGNGDPLEETYCQRVVMGDLPGVIPNTADFEVARNLPITRTLNIGAYLSAPIQLPDGQVYGTFCCLSHQPENNLNQRDLQVLRAFAEVAGQHIEKHHRQTQERQDKIRRIQQVFTGDLLSMVYQPFVEVTTGKLVGIEVLSRFASEPYLTPDIWFAEAHQVNLGVELEAFAIRKALMELLELPGSFQMAFNVSPQMLLSPQLEGVLQGHPLDRITLELSERAPVQDYSVLLERLKFWRSQGLRFAIDDAGADHASMRHLLHLHPDTLKIDMSLTRGIDVHPGRRSLTTALVAFASEIGSTLVAEGVETRGELHTFRQLRVQQAQGHLLHRPVSVADLGEMLKDQGAC